MYGYYKVQYPYNVHFKASNFPADAQYQKTLLLATHHFVDDINTIEETHGCSLNRWVG